MKNYDLIIIGGGSAGMAAAISAYDAGIKNILILEKDKFLGGILLQCIHTGFGLSEFKEELTGPEYAYRFIKEIEKRNISYLLETTVLEITEEKDVYYANSNEGYQLVRAKSIILATGCLERTRGAIFLPGDRPAGIMTAGLAQKYLNIDGYLVGKKVFILGSGDIGLIMARRMTLEGAEVLGVAELMPYSNGLNRNISQCLNDFNIPLYLSHTITNIKGKSRLEEVEISEVDSNLKPIEGTEKSFKVDTLLLSVGLLPSIELLKGLNVKANNKTKSIFINESLETTIPGIFCCGNALHVHDLVDFVTKEAREAGLSSAKYIMGKLTTSYNNTLNIESGLGINYVLPNIVRLDNISKDLKLSFRVKKPFNNVNIAIFINKKLVKEVKKAYLLPAEMESIIISKDCLEKGNLEILVRE